jgi:hypothetical protein
MMQKDDRMIYNTKHFKLILGIGLALIMSSRAFADTDFQKKEFEEFKFFKQLTAEWWQWALSIPTPVNPQLDATGDNGVVGQRGSVWFLAGAFDGFQGGTVTRTLSVPEGKALFFPVINDIEINTPGVCGSPPNNVSVRELRDTAASHISGAINLSVTLDGKTIKDLRRVKSEVFEVALPEDNVFDSPCAGLGGVKAGIYSPAVDEGFYVLLDPLSVGPPHTLHFHAENPSQAVFEDITYILNVMPVSLK